MTDTSTIPSADDMAKAALGEPTSPTSATPISTDDEVAASDQMAQALTSLQNLIERNARELTRINKELAEQREMMKNVFENDAELATATELAQEVTTKAKERKAKLQTDPQVTGLKVKIGELNEQKKELEETLSNHLVNYYQYTHSTSFDTSDGDQWEFQIKAKVKGNKKTQE